MNVCEPLNDNSCSFYTTVRFAGGERCRLAPGHVGPHELPEELVGGSALYVLRVPQPRREPNAE